VTPVPPHIRDEVIARSNGKCELPGCLQDAGELHHRKMRSQGGSHSATNLLAVCKVHHIWIHENPAMSYERGWLVKSWDTPT
jgi:5-methylcytosine-specific restriction endonuclease McrA